MTDQRPAPQADRLPSPLRRRYRATALGIPDRRCRVEGAVVFEGRRLLPATDQARWFRMPALVAQGKRIEFVLRGSGRSQRPPALGTRRANLGDAI